MTDKKVTESYAAAMVQVERDKITALEKDMDAILDERNTARTQLEACLKVKAMADQAIVDQHGHIQQLQQLLARYLV